MKDSAHTPAPDILDALAAATADATVALVLRWERHWHEPEGENPDPDDLKRETEHLRLPVTAEELSKLTAAAKKAGARVTQTESESVIEFLPAPRQPAKLTLTTKKFVLVPSALLAEGTTLRFSEPANLRDAVQAAVIAARYPQLVVSAPALSEEISDWEKIPAAARRIFFRGIILSRRPSAGFRFLDKIGLLDKFLPEVTAGRHLTQNRFHVHDIFEHLLRSVDGAYDLNEPVRWSALLHDVGKVPTRVETANGEATFHNHEMYSARMVVPIMKRLAVPITIGQKVKFLVRNHMFHYTDEWSDKAVRRFVKKVPTDELQDLISLRLADRKGSGKKTAFPKALQKLIDHIDEIIAKEKEFKIRDLAIDGHQLMELGMPASRQMGDLLKFLCEEVKAGKLENTKEALTAIALQHIGEKTK